MGDYLPPATTTDHAVIEVDVEVGDHDHHVDTDTDTSVDGAELLDVDLVVG